MQLDIEREEVDKDLFIEYIKENPTSSSYERENFRQKKYEQVQQYKSKSKSKAAYQSYDL